MAYIRVSSTDQKVDRQVEAVGEVDRAFTDKVSGKSVDRPALTESLQYVREGDTVVVASLDRFDRNLVDLWRLVAALTGRSVTVEFLKERLTFTADDSPMNTLLLNMLGAVAEFERSLIRECQREGIALAKAAGIYKGAQPSLTAEPSSRPASGSLTVSRSFGWRGSRSGPLDALRRAPGHRPLRQTGRCGGMTTGHHDPDGSEPTTSAGFRDVPVFHVVEQAAHGLRRLCGRLKEWFSGTE